VLVVGAGGLGSPVALWLAAAGVGRLGLVDPDRVDLSNLHRQLLYGDADVGQPKVEAARRRLAAVDSGTRVETFPVALDAGNADALVAGWDVAIDATDAIPPRYALSDACVRAGVPMVHGSVSRWEGRVTVLAARGAPCYRCLFPDPPPPATVPTCADAGVLGVVPGMVGMLQATETLKLLAGVGEPLVGRLWVSDFRTHASHRFVVTRNRLCRACGDGQIRGEGDAPAVDAAVAAPSPAPPEPSCVTHSLADDDMTIPELSPAELAEQMRGPQPPVVLDVREPWEHGLARIEGARLVPLNMLPHALSTFDPGRAYVVLCHHGARSLLAAQFLRERGLRQVSNLTGGIDAWSEAVDPSVPKY
jgi:adenylyltransferase/sulfurtransferase